MSDRMSKVGERLRLAGAGTLLALQPWQRRVCNHLMLVEEERNKAKAVGMDPATVDSIVDEVRSEARTRVDGDVDWVDRQIAERCDSALQTFTRGEYRVGEIES